MKRILIVEDNEDIRALYKRILRKAPEIEAFEASDADEALSLVEKVSPDLLLVDISLPRMNGIEFTRKIHMDLPNIKILIVTGHEISRYYDEAMKAGANDVISKDAASELVEICRDVMNSEPRP
jgi:DNA-binding NarL/FixJ family response regulator